MNAHSIRWRDELLDVMEDSLNSLIGALKGTSDRDTEVTVVRLDDPTKPNSVH